MSVINLSLPEGESVCNGKHVSFSAPCACTGVTGVKIGEEGNWFSSTLPSSASWKSIIYGNGKFVAITTSSNIAAYSTDGINWTASTLPYSILWMSVTYGNGKFVAVAMNTNKSAYSTDGITWTASTLPYSAEYWESVTYGDGKFVAVSGGNFSSGSSNIAAYSTDGINWTASTLPSSKIWYSVTYGNGKFVAVAHNTHTVAYSTDGINWNSSSLPSSEYWESVTYGDGKFVAVVLDSNKSAYSADGINWTASTLPSSRYWRSVTYGNGKFIAVSSGHISSEVSNVSAYSTDGITWTSATLPDELYWMSVTYGDGKFVAVSYSTSTAAYFPLAPIYTLVNAEGNDYVANGGSWVSGAYMTIMLDCTNSKAYVVSDHSLELPNVTSSDNNKILKVVNGVWAKADAPSGAQSASITLTVAGWTQQSNNAYSQAITISNKGLTANSNVIIDCALSMSDLDADVEVLTAWGDVNNAVATTDTLTFWCYAEQPTVAIPVSVVIS